GIPVPRPRMLSDIKEMQESAKLYNGEQLEELENLQMSVMKTNRPILYNRHMYYINYTEFGHPDPLYMNFIRDPVERFISYYYYMRSQNHTGVPNIESSTSVDECVSLGDPDCLPEKGQDFEFQLSYFCGHHPSCREVGNLDALQQAKYVAEKHYSVVGVLELWETSFKVLEHYLPRFFKYSKELIENLPRHMLQKNKGINRKPYSNLTEQTLRKAFKEDIEFYNFIKQRLYLQSKYIDISSSNH
ncbi:unnamed protein product, partial [Meganyctiphanes norvegica]